MRKTMQKDKGKRKNFVKIGNAGFTLVEVLVVISIIGIMLLVGFNYLKSNEFKIMITTSQRELAATLRLAQGYALQGKMQQGETPCGYGVIFTSEKDYQIFYNSPTPTDLTCEEINENPDDSSFSQFFKYVEGQSELIGNEKYSLKPGVQLSDFDPDAENWVYFAVPHGNVYFGENTFEIEKGTLIKEVKITSAGSISEE